MKHKTFILIGAFIGTILFFSHNSGTAFAADCTGGPAVCGQNSGLVPFHKDAIAASLIWPDQKQYEKGKKNEKFQCPKMLIWMRPSEYKPSDYLSPTVGGVFSGFNQKYIDLVQGGFGLGPLDRSGWSRYAPDIARENTQLIDVCGLQALIDTTEFTTNLATLPITNFILTDRFFENAGFSKGLGYNIFCSGNVLGADGRLYIIGGHDKGGNNGIKKIIIFDPQSGNWKPRTVPCVKSQFEADPTGTFAHCNPLDENNTDPADPSDMKYQRWYPTGVTLPDGRILILSGSDQDTSVGPDAAAGTKVRQAVPEVYDPITDRTVALENAQKLLPMYPRSYVVQTGPGQQDWKVCLMGEVEPPLPIGAALRGYDPFTYNGKTYCLNVLAALADPARDIRAENHWEFVTTAQNPHEGSGSAMLVTINADGTSSQKVFAAGGSDNDGPNVATVEMIDYSLPSPTWERLDDLLVATTQNNVVALPDGKLLVVGGRRNNSLQYQMFDPADGSRTDLIISSIPRHDHSTALLMPNGGVWVMGGNRTDLLPAVNENLSVPALEYYRPPYFFKGPRPAIAKAPDKIKHGKTFRVKVSGASDEIGSVAIIRTGPITHNWVWGNVYIKLPFTTNGKGPLKVTSPPLPGLAIPGDYLLFVVSKAGVPSEGKHLRLKLSGDEDGDGDDDSVD